MESNQSTPLGAESSAILVSGKFRNDADGLIWPTKSQFFAPSGLRCAFLVVDKDRGEKPASPEDAKNWSNDSMQTWNDLSVQPETLSRVWRTGFCVILSEFLYRWLVAFKQKLRQKEPKSDSPAGFCINCPLSAEFFLQRASPCTAKSSLILNNFCKIKPCSEFRVEHLDKSRSVGRTLHSPFGSHFYKNSKGTAPELINSFSVFSSYICSMCVSNTKTHPKSKQQAKQPCPGPSM